MQSHHKTNVDKLIAANLLDPSVGQEDKDLINSFSDDEIEAIIRVGAKALSKTPHGKALVKVGF